MASSAPIQTPHGDLLRVKAATNPLLVPVLQKYAEFTARAHDITVVDEVAVRQLVQALNEYRDHAIYVFEDGRNVPQETLRSSLLEEFFSWLFKDVFLALDEEVPESFRIGRAADSYVKMTFAPKNFLSAFVDPNARVTTKQQDFALGVSLRVEVGTRSADGKISVQHVLLPVVAIECKTYLAKNHLDMCASTAAEIRGAAPYCMYLVASEFLKIARTVTPEFTDIAEIFILCVAHNTDRAPRKAAGYPVHPVSEMVVVNLFEMVMRHLRSVWWDPDTAVARGQIISRPF